MGRLEEMTRTLGANVGESMGEGRHAVHRVPTAEVPARLRGVAKSRNAAEIPVDRIVPDPDQPREQFDEESLGRLAESMKSKGQLQPIRVHWSEERGAYVIVCGERRWRAAVQAGLSALTCIVMDAPASQEELLVLQLIENCCREDLQPIERARAFKSLAERNGWSVRRVADEVGCSHVSVVRAMSLLDMPESVQERVAEGDLPPATAYEISKVEDRDAQEELARAIVDEKLTRSEVAEVVRSVRARRPAPSRRPDPVVVDLGDITITVRWKRFSETTVAEALREALAQVDAA
ncbi:MAG: ParB/RepB/Spo0J family partition protein [Singulisphaera sp.]|nr:ParB/RepB/Spo0J family partition protein [Singulisphaera sp.]